MESRRGREVLARLRVEGLEERPVVVDRPQRPELPVVVVSVPQRTVAEQTRVVPVSERIGQQRQRMVGDVVLQRVRHGSVAREVLGVETQRNVAPLDIGVDVRPQPVLRPGRRGRLAERLVGRRDVEVAQPLHPRIDDDRNGRVALHREGFAAVQLPLGHPPPLLVHADHRTHHVQLPLGIDQRQQLVHVAVGIPQREDRVTVVLRDARLTGTLHDRILAVHVVHEVRVDQRMVQRRIEHGLLLRRAALDADARKVVVPPCAGRPADRVERRSGGLFGVEVPAGVLHAHIGNAHAHLDLFALPEVVEREPVAHVVARQFAAVLRVKLVFAVVGGPLRLDARHRTLLLPVARRRRGFRHAQHEIHRKHLLRVVAERPQQFHALDLRSAHAAHRSARLVREALAQIQQDVPLPGGKRVALGRGARRGRRFGPDAVLVQRHGVVARRGRFIFIRRAVLLVIHRQRPGRRHRQQRPHLGTSHAAQRPVGEAREEFVMVLVRSRPPAGVLVVDVRVRTHHVERNHRHHAVRAQGPGIGRAEVGRADEGIDPIDGLLRTQRCAENGCGERRSRKRSSQSHQRIEFFFVNSTISGIYPNASPVTVSAQP